MSIQCLRNSLKKGKGEMKFLLVMCVINAFAASAYALSPKVALRVRVMDEGSRFFV